MPLGRGLSGWVIERPGRQLNDEALASLTGDLRSIANATLDETSLDYGVFDEQSGALDSSIITIIYDTKTHTPVAFNAMPLIELDIQDKPVEVVHLGLVMINPNTRGKGLSSMLYGFACAMLMIRKQFQPIWVSSVTQVPAVFGLVSELYSETFPSAKEGARRSFMQLQLARRIMQHHRSVFGVGDEAGFDEETFVITNAYTGGSDNLKKSFADAPKHRRDTYNDMCEEHLDYERGDDFLQIGRLDMAALRHYIFRTLPATSPIGAFAALMFFGLQYVYLPVRHWLDASKEWGGLRPWKT